MSFILSSHATHLLQSLDVVCFQSYKYYHHQALDQSLCLSIFDFNQLDFIITFIKIRLTARTRISRPGPVPSRPHAGMGWGIGRDLCEMGWDGTSLAWDQDES